MLPHCDEIRTLSERLTRLERQNRALRRLTLLGAVAAAIVAVGAQRPQRAEQPGAVRVRELVLVDEAGRARARLTAERALAFQLYGASDSLAAQLVLTPEPNLLLLKRAPRGGDRPVFSAPTPLPLAHPTPLP